MFKNQTKLNSFKYYSEMSQDTSQDVSQDMSWDIFFFDGLYWFLINSFTGLSNFATYYAQRFAFRQLY